MAPLSESSALDEALDRVNIVEDALYDKSHRAHGIKAIAELVAIITRLREQASKGVHRNPPLVTMLGNPRGRHLLSKQVQAVLYVHAEDGGYYCHGFGNADLKLKTHGDAVRIDGLKSRTGVEAWLLGDGSVHLVGKNGQALWMDDGA